MARFLCSAFADEAAQDIQGQIAACKANGIEAIELRGVNGENISDFTPEQAKELKKTLRKAGIGVSSIGSNYGKKAFDFEAFQQTVEVAKILGAKYIRMFSFYGGDKAQAFADVKTMADYAYENGVLCCHENERHIHGEGPQACKELLDYCEGHLGCVFDFANFLHCGVETWPAYEILKPYITYFHVKDYCTDWQATVPAGWGAGKLPEILTDFDQSCRGEVWLSIEPHLKVFDGLGEFDPETKKKLEERQLYATQAESFAQAATCLHEVIAQAQPVALGIIGYGNMGSSHMGMYLKGEHKGLRITAVADTNPDRLEAAADDLPGIAVFGGAEELIASGACNAVLIATPHYFHPPIAIAALEAGLHVMSEKPAGVYTKQVREMNEAAAKSGKIFAIMFNQRSEPRYRKLRELVRSGQYGGLIRVTWIICDWYRTQAYYNSGGWRATWAGEGGGVLLNQCPHNLDLWQWICGMPSKILARCHEGKWHDIEVEDDVTIYAEYPNGATGAFITTTGEPAGVNRLEITLDGAKLLCEHGRVTVVEIDGSTKEHILTCSAGFGEPKMADLAPEVPGLGASQHATVLNAFAAAVAADDPGLLYARGEEGINGLSISNAAFLSSWLGREIDLPLDEELFWAELQKKIAGSQVKTGVKDQVAGDMGSSFR